MNYYEILNVSQKASKSEIKSSYKKLVKKYHPDLYKGDKDFAEHKIKEINEAYNILSNQQSKAEYDEYLNSLSDNYEISYEPAPQIDEDNWTFSKFLFDKINNLGKKRQIQLFLIILLITLFLFLYNAIELQYYLKNNTQNETIKNNATNSIEPDISNTFDDNLTIDELESLDDLINEIFKPYFDINNQTEF